MKSVLAPIEGVRKLLGATSYDEGTSYVPTMYSLDIACDDGRLLYNTLTGEIVLFESQDMASLPLKTLVEKRFYVAQVFDECALVQQVKAIVGNLQPVTHGVTSYTILTTTDCNARCPYCYEHGIARKNMSEQIACGVAGHIAEYCEGEAVSIHWFGGEPLYNTSAIDAIACGLNDRNVCFESHMTSNGFYLDSAVSARAKQSWHLKSVQITIDGTERVYNRIKAYIDSTGSDYEHVLSNIDHALDNGIEVFVRLNMDAANVDDLHLVCDDLAERFSNRMGLKAVVMPLVSLSGRIHEFDNADSKIQGYKELTDHLSEAGLAYFGELPRKLRINRCKADSPSTEVILPDGQIAKCEHFDEDEYIGSIYSSWRDETIMASWAKKADVKQECLACPLFPLCTPLERCAWDKVGCDEALRAMRTYRYKQKILTEYERYKGRTK